jgi:hypothetical protein
LPQLAAISPVGLGPPLRSPGIRDSRRIGQMRREAGPLQLLDDEAPAGAALHRKRHLTLVSEPAQELSQRRPARRADLPATHLPRLGVQHIERDLSTMHINRAYDGHRSLL